MSIFLQSILKVFIYSIFGLFLSIPQKSSIYAIRFPPPSTPFVPSSFFCSEKFAQSQILLLPSTNRLPNLWSSFFLQQIVRPISDPPYSFFLGSEFDFDDSLFIIMFHGFVLKKKSNLGSWHIEMPKFYSNHRSGNSNCSNTSMMFMINQLLWWYWLGKEKKTEEKGKK